MKARRAAVLADRHPGAAEMLRFYQRLVAVQQKLTGRSAEEFREFLDGMRTIGNQQVSANAREMLKKDATQHQELLDACWEGESADFFARAFLQPHAESLGKDCPWCRKHPQVSILRDAAQGARRSLACALCSREWTYPRVQCVYCQEQNFDSLPVFTNEEQPQVRVEACDSCQSYLISLDMTKDGLVVPLVDELAAVSMNLWAQEQGYARRIPNLLGI